MDAMAKEPANNFFVQQLRALPAERGLFFDSKGAWIRCPNPAHSNGMERTPSLKVNVYEGKYQGSFHCFGCKIKGGWNKLVKYFPQLSPVSSGQKAATIGFSFKHFDREEEVPDFSQYIPWNIDKSWRGINGKTLRLFDTKVVPFRDDYNLMFPITTYGQPVGYIRAISNEPRRDKHGKKERTYFNMEGDWASGSLFGFDLAVQRAKTVRGLGKPVVLWVVEGPRDTLNVTQHGGIAVGLIGSAVNARKLALVMEVDPDVVIIATDNDPAGNLAADKILNGHYPKDSKKEWFDGIGTLIPCVRLKFKDGRDPADLTQDKVRNIIIKARRRV